MVNIFNLVKMIILGQNIISISMEIIWIIMEILSPCHHGKMISNDHVYQDTMCLLKWNGCMQFIHFDLLSINQMLFLYYKILSSSHVQESN